MGGAVKILSLLSVPLPLLYPRRPSALLRLSAAAFSSHRRLRLLSETPRRSSSTVRTSRQTHTQTLSNEPPLHDSLHHQPETIARAWPEWARLVQWLTNKGYVDRARATSDRLCEDDFVERDDLPEEFLRAGEALILFARENPELLSSLSKKEIGIVVDNGSPFLFKDGESSIRRLRNFLSDNYDYVLQSGKAQTIDLIRYLLSYVSNIDNNCNNKVSDASVKNLLVELVNVSGTTRAPNFAEPNQSPPGQTISWKAGDWFCSKCNFMNFARNTKCLECSEPKPKRILIGGEWECPQCDFFNYGRNMSCLRCDCKRPGEIPLPCTTSKTSTLEEILNKSTIEVSSNAPHNIKTSVNRYVPDMFAKSKTTENFEAESGPSDEGFPEMMPVRKGENRFVVGRKKDRSLTSPQYKRRIAMEQANSSNSEFVPFVPFPPDYFAKKRENKLSEMGPTSEKTEETNTRGINNNVYSNSRDNLNSQSGNENANGNYSAQPNNPSGYNHSSYPNTTNSNFNTLDMSEEAKAERWFKRAAQIKDISELENIPDEDFPEIMPMRKGVNRFVISKRKTPLERRLTSSQYRRNLPIIKSDPEKD